MVKRKRTNTDGSDSSRKKVSHSRIGRACDRCQYRKLACDPTEHSCQQCQKANTWCTITDNLSGIPAYRGQYEYLERLVEKQHQENKDLVQQLQNLGQDVSGFDLRDNEAIRYRAWQQARAMEPSRPWEKEDRQANYTKDLVLRNESRQSSCSRRSDKLEDSLPSPELTPSEAFTFLTQPCRPHRSSSIYSAPPQLPSRSPTVPAKSSNVRAEIEPSYHSDTRPDFMNARHSPNSIRASYIRSVPMSSPGMMGSTFADQHLSPHMQMSTGPVYAPDGSTWYSYTSGAGEIQNYAMATTMMPSNTSAYALVTTTGYHPGISAHEDYPLVVIDTVPHI